MVVPVIVRVVVIVVVVIVVGAHSTDPIAPRPAPRTRTGARSRAPTSSPLLITHPSTRVPGRVIADDKIAEIRERTDVVALIGEYVALKRAGAQFKGLCPFHSEKTPSFHVHPERQFFHCFGCQASGDAFAFVMKLEGRSFIEAARMLAERAGIEIAPEDAREEAAHRQARQERDRLLACTEAAAGFFVKMIDEHPLGGMARDAILKRSVTLETARTYRLGYAPHGWDHLARFLAERGFSARDAENAGLIVPRRSGDGYYDRFRHRLMFPIADVHGRIVAFSGRILDPPPNDPPREGQDPPAKYVNSPEGPLYKKGELLFGLHEARVDLRRESHAILCEGNFDVLAVHQAGHKNVVAPLGTAFTAMQAKLLRRYVAKVTLLFDGDRAGRKAVAAAHPLLSGEALVTKVASLPPGEDPDSYVRAKGPEALRDLIAAGLPIVEHLIESSAADAGADPAARAAAIESLGPVLMAIRNPVEARLWVERIAQAFEIHDLEAVRRQLRKGIRQPTRKPTQGSPPDTAPKPPSPPPEYPEIEKDVVGAMLDHPGLLGSSEAAMLDALLTSEDLRAILRHAAHLVGSRGVVDAAALLASIGESPARTWLEERLSVQTFDAAGAESFLRTALPHLRKRRIERELRALAPLIKQALVRGDVERATELMRRRDELYRMAAQPQPSAEKS
ncbi:DNA primase [Sandaracinus amylolyticus]|uniref:DNA primase n=1 Tax=Sandaracinus amylolyticus TaxID=927083 RepID=UPI00146FFE05|nr:DNA primase [Sandaracinus amylolyticus]